MSSHARKTINHAMIYSLGNMLRHAVSIIMLPIYTRYLTPADYGVVELLSMLLDFMGIVLGMRIGDAVFRHYCMAETDREKHSVITSSLVIAGGLNAVGVMIVLLLAGFFSNVMFGSDEYENIISIFSWTMLFALSEVCYIYIRAIQKPWVFIAFNVTQLTVQLSLNIYFVVLKDMHVEGVVYSALISGAIITILLLMYTVAKIQIKFSLRKMKELIMFSLPIMMAGLGAFYLTFGDRYFLRVFGSLEEVGIYSLGYKFGFILLVIVWNPFNKIWDSQKYLILKKDNAIEILQKTFMAMSILLIGAGLGIALMVGDLLKIMSDPAFHSAAVVVPVILVAYIVQAWTGYSNLGILIKGNTSQIMYGTIAAIIAITISYFLLIPKYGAIGAAWGTLIGFLVRLLWINHKASKSYDMRLPWMKVFLILLTAVTVYMITFIVPNNIVLSIMYRSVLFVVFFLLLVTLPILSAQEKEILISIIKNPLRAPKLLST